MEKWTLTAQPEFVVVDGGQRAAVLLDSGARGGRCLAHLQLDLVRERLLALRPSSARAYRSQVSGGAGLRMAVRMIVGKRATGAVKTPPADSVALRFVCLHISACRTCVTAPRTNWFVSRGANAPRQPVERTRPRTTLGTSVLCAAAAECALRNH